MCVAAGVAIRYPCRIGQNFAADLQEVGDLRPTACIADFAAAAVAVSLADAVAPVVDIAVAVVGTAVVVAGIAKIIE